MGHKKHRSWIEEREPVWHRDSASRRRTNKRQILITPNWGIVSYWILSRNEEGIQPLWHHIITKWVLGWEYIYEWMMCCWLFTNSTVESISGVRMELIFEQIWNKLSSMWIIGRRIHLGYQEFQFFLLLVLNLAKYHAIISGAMHCNYINNLSSILWTSKIHHCRLNIALVLLCVST